MTEAHNQNALSSEIDRRLFLSVAAAAATLPLVSQASAQPQPGVGSGPRPGSDMVRLQKRTPQIWRVTISNPPFNLVVPELVSALHAVVTETERDPEVKVVLFASDIEGYFINHFDLSKALDFPMEATSPPTSTWTDMVVRMTRSPAINIAVVRGRTRGGGDEFALACDMRYASREKAFFGQPEVGAGILPGGGASERLPRLIGRDRALEIILSSRDYGGEDAERLGLVTRALPDGELDAFVDSLATRLGGFDRQALAAAKAQVNRATLPPEADLHAAYVEYVASLDWPGFKARRPRMGKLVSEYGADVERRLGHYLGLAN
ncbi:enoyl-CoA hydratase/isomerase family protein [Methylopila sp. Yamaguchi]|uniref:enoyl-CoA hydratase/isomerase family protein n=1 Tax=Methylopila sp. Yamaguchi TaxID=1437817 RepID=UPI000CAA9260|nr:enoyl-CoA hydratase/isomerase family protein [Methylopila sp. Yamaguchi]GBD49794.1 enoyl-CoA hydratase [Methylopila sp. Yamaguchi]